MSFAAIDLGGVIPTGAIRHALGWHLRDLTDFEFRFVIPGGKIATLKNSKKAVRLSGGRLAVVSSPQATAYLKHLAFHLRCDWLGVFRLDVSIPRDVDINAAIVSYLPTERATDSDNLLQAPGDAMQRHRPSCNTNPRKPECQRHAGVIVDDHQIRTHNGSDQFVDPDNPRVEITLTPYDPGAARVYPLDEEVEF